jgi:hypothetical protein
LQNLNQKYHPKTFQQTYLLFAQQKFKVNIFNKCRFC